MDWTNESILRFLRLYKSHQCLWDTKQTKLHRNRDRVNEAWLAIQNDMKIPCTVQQLKKKKESLMSAYRAYKTKIKNSTSVVGGKVYRPSWFAFELMDSFLSTVYLCNASNYKTYQENDNAETDSRLDSEDDSHLKKRQKLNVDDIEEDSLPPDPEVEEECEILTKLWARKLRKLPEARRDNVIYQINNILYRECVENHRQNVSLPSPVHVFKEECISNCSDESKDIELKDDEGSYIVSITKTEPDDE